MSPVPLIHLQRRLAEAGRIRMGEKTDKGAPKRLSTWRVTSPTKALIEELAGIHGGTVKPWESPVGPQWEVVTETAELPVLLMPGYSLKQLYELWSGPTKCERRCDGDEMMDGSPCLCNAEQIDKCELRTRLTVALPELQTMLGWRVETKGDNAAKELAGGMQLVEAMAQGRTFVPGTLRLVERRGAVNGQAVRYVVPVIDLNIRYGQMLPAGEPVPQPGYKALPAPTVTLEQGLEAVNAERKVSRSGRSAAPIGPEAEPGPESVEPLTPPDDGPSGPVATEPQRRKIFAIASERGVTEERLRELIAQVNEGNDSTKELPKALVDAVLTALDAEPGREEQTHFPIPRGARGSKR
jgi:recombination directionality factor gp3-like protein